ncbi:MAG TPA: hypothetical protein VGR81_00395 [Candidatus Acidoferrales bacterium]|nr:hypothetical protein [Candidatus Acidoferrales bacterium]
MPLTKDKSGGILGAESLKIVLVSVAAAMGYGIVHDEVTIRVCAEYFTVAHAHLPLLHSSSATIVALGWGVATSWWAGLAIGIALAIAARAGSLHKFTWRDFLRPIAWLLFAMAAVAALAGFAGWWLTETGRITAMQAWAAMLPFDRQGVFMADVWAHASNYLSGSIGGLLLVAHTLWQRVSAPIA